MTIDVQIVEQVLAAAVIGGVIGLDRTALGQFMVSQPIVAGPLTGWLLGDLTAGLVIGAVLELIWVLDLPIGTFVPADSTVAAVAATAIAAISGRSDLAVVGFSLLLTVIMVPFTMYADNLLRKRNRQIPDLAVAGDGSPTEARVTAWHLAGLLAFFLKSFVLCLGFVAAGVPLALWFRQAPELYQRAMTIFVMLLPLLGVASMTRKLTTSTLDRALFIGFLCGAVGVMVLKVPVLAAVVVAAIGGWMEVRSRGI
jgi:mannose/fructose/N-acetylgalactosamine-specific phosphotransferase system component IIC